MPDLSNAIDVHVHAGPSFFDRKIEPISLTAAYDEQGLGGLLLKSHFGNTHVARSLAAARVPDVSVYSSTTLNSFVGGFNPMAVEHALATDARVVWLPTFSAANFSPEGIGRDFPFSDQSLVALREDGTLKPAVNAVLETLADADRRVALGNGHLSAAETFAILHRIEEQGYDIPYLITHADFPFMSLAVEDQIELAERGCVIEKCYLPVVHGDISPAAMVESIDAIGADRCVLSTDHGQANNRSPPLAYRAFVEQLTDAGLSNREVEQMVTAATDLVAPD